MNDPVERAAYEALVQNCEQGSFCPGEPTRPPMTCAQAWAAIGMILAPWALGCVLIVLWVLYA